MEIFPHTFYPLFLSPILSMTFFPVCLTHFVASCLAAIFSNKNFFQVFLIAFGDFGNLVFF